MENKGTSVSVCVCSTYLLEDSISLTRPSYIDAQFKSSYCKDSYCWTHQTDTVAAKNVAQIFKLLLMY